MPHAALAAGVPAGALGWRWTTARDPHASAAATGGRYEVLTPAWHEENPLPLGVESADALDPDAGWWGYSMADVPDRLSGETALLTLPHARLVCDRGANGDFWAGLLDADGRAPTVRELTFKPRLAAAARTREKRAGSGVWIAERVYHNHSHWLTAHLPKLALLKRLGRLGELVMPERTNAVIEASMRLAGVEPGEVRRVRAEGVLRFDELTLLVTDRFRRDLLREGAALVRARADGEAARRVYVSRERARARRLVNEEEVWPLFERAGFERLSFEGMSLDEQRGALADVCVLAGPHGAGLTNQLFCPPGATVIEIADPGYPNPNFYALACALGHRYARVEAETVGEGHRLYRDLRADPSRVAEALERFVS
jgi:hypothetical protein